MLAWSSTPTDARMTFLHGVHQKGQLKMSHSNGSLDANPGAYPMLEECWISPQRPKTRRMKGIGSMLIWVDLLVRACMLTTGQSKDLINASKAAIRATVSVGAPILKQMVLNRFETWRVFSVRHDLHFILL